MVALIQNYIYTTLKKNLMTKAKKWIKIPATRVYMNKTHIYYSNRNCYLRNTGNSCKTQTSLVVLASNDSNTVIYRSSSTNCIYIYIYMGIVSPGAFRESSKKNKSVKKKTYIYISSSHCIRPYGTFELYCNLHIICFFYFIWVHPSRIVFFLCVAWFKKYE